MKLSTVIRELLSFEAGLPTVLRIVNKKPEKKEKKNVFTSSKYCLPFKALAGFEIH